MDKVKKVPEIRFDVFENTWHVEKLNQLCDVRDGTHDSPKYLENGYYFITSKNVNEGKINFDEVKFISKEDYDNINKRSKVDVGDILFGMIGTVGNIAIVRNVPNYAIKNVALIKDIQKVYNYFNYYFLQSSNIEKQLDSGLDGGTQKFISLKSIRNLDVFFPKSDEQTQIGNFFNNLDEKLELEKEKHQKLVNFKKAMLDDMFPKEGEKVPKVRFEGFHNEWVDIFLNEVCEVNNGNMNTQDADINGIYPFFIRSEEIMKSNRYLYDEEAILTPGEGKIGEIFHYINGKYSAHQRVYRLFNFNEHITPVFLIYTLKNSFKAHALKNSSTATAPSIRKGTITGFCFKNCSTDEQVLIGNFLKNLDKKIELSEKKIKKIENFKKAMLDKMFV